MLFHESLSHHAPHTSRKKSVSGPPVPPKDLSDKSAARLRYLCPLCDLYFRKASLKSHLMKHTGEAPFHCLFCSRFVQVTCGSASGLHRCPATDPRSRGLTVIGRMTCKNRFKYAEINSSNHSPFENGREFRSLSYQLHPRKAVIVQCYLAISSKFFMCTFSMNCERTGTSVCQRLLAPLSFDVARPKPPR